MERDFAQDSVWNGREKRRERSFDAPRLCRKGFCATYTHDTRKLMTSPIQTARLRSWAASRSCMALLLITSSNALAQVKLIEVDKLLATGTSQAVRDYYGHSVSVGGSFAIIGAPEDDDTSFRSGAAYIYQRQPDGSWKQIQKLVPDGPDIGGLKRSYGRAVAISGNYAVVGPAVTQDNNPQGAQAVYVFERNPDGVFEEVKVLTPDADQGLSRFGSSVAISGRNLIVGDFVDRDGSVPTGAAYIYERISGVWKEVKKVRASDASESALFGYSVAIRYVATISGNYAVVGAPLAEKAYIFIRSINGVWEQEEIVQASDGFDKNNFGYAVGISGTSAIIGANRDDENGAFAGAAYIYKRIGENNWFEQAKLTPLNGGANDLFGSTVAISGSKAVVGTTLNDPLFSDDDSSSMPEAAYVFERSPADAWVEWAKVQASDGGVDHDFGSAVSISGDHVVIGSRRDDANGEDSGSGYFLSRTDQESWQETVKVVPQDGAPTELFGLSTNLDAGRAIVGGRFERVEGSLFGGRAYIYQRNEQGQWRTTAGLVSATNDSIYSTGRYADLSGEWAVVGVPGDDDKANNSGAVFVYREQPDGSWSEVQKLVIQAGSSGGFLGESVAIDGHHAVFSTNSGSAYVFEKTPGDVWVEWGVLTPSGGTSARVVALQADEAFVGDSLADGKGAVYVFKRNAGGTWLESQKITANDGVAEDGFGTAIAVRGDRLVISALYDNDRGEDAGSVYVFERDSGGPWNQRRKLLASDGTDGDNFGWEVALDQDRIAVATIRGSNTGNGAAYLFSRNDLGIWEEAPRIDPDHIIGADFFGASVALEGDTLLLGDFFDYVNGERSGSARVYIIGGDLIFAGDFEDPDGDPNP